MNSVCVVIPHYNDLAGLGNALRSVSNQSRKADQIVVIDDDSPKEVWGELETLSKEYGFELYHQSNQGQSAARNLGVSKTNCSHICFLDQDDLFLENHIEDLLEAWDDNPRLAFTYGDAWRQSEKGDIYVRTTYRKDLKIKEASIFDLARKDILITPGMTMYSRAHFQAVGGFDEDLRGYEDDDLIFRLSANGAEGKKIRAAVVIWTLNLTSTSFSIAMQKSRDLYFRKLCKFFDSPTFESMGFNVFPDLFLGRFYKVMLNDAIRLAKVGGPDFEVVQNNLRFFCETGLESKGLTRQQRRSLRFSLFAITKIPPSGIKASFNFAIKVKAFLKL